MQTLICQNILDKQSVKALTNKPLPKPPGHEYISFEGYWVAVGTKEPIVPENYVLTPSVRANLKDLARIVSAGYVFCLLGLIWFKVKVIRIEQ